MNNSQNTKRTQRIINELGKEQIRLQNKYKGKAVKKNDSQSYFCMWISISCAYCGREYSTPFNICGRFCHTCHRDIITGKKK